MKFVLFNISVILFIMSGSLLASEALFEIGWWKQQSLNGSVVLEGLYRSQKTILRSGKTEEPATQKLLGQFKLNSQSYIWHPNFSKININFEFNPGLQNEQFLVIPNRSETRTAEQMRIQSVFFDQKPLSFNLFYNLNHNYINREYTTNVEALNTDFGGGISYRNNFIPTTMSYLNSGWKQNEIQTGREFINDRRNIRIELNKSFVQYDRHRFSYSYDDYSRKYGNASSIRNKVNGFRLQNDIPFDKDRRSSWNSLAFYHSQTGNQEYERLQINENLRIDLPAGFKLSGLYRYAGYDQPIVSTKQHNVLTQLEHQLFLSLRSRIFYEYIDLNHTVYNEFTNQTGVAFDYNKGIPTGSLNLTYEYRNRNDNRTSGSGLLYIAQEEYALSDDQIILLKNPDIISSSVIVRDETGTIVYQVNIDYILIERGVFLEIQRLPGGQIGTGQSVFLDYTVQRSDSYKYGTNSNFFTIGLSLFDRLLNTYFRYYTQSYDNVIKAENKILKTTLQRVYGLRLSRSFLTAGVEFDNYESNVVPYSSRRIFLTLTKSFTNRLNASVSTNWRNYDLTSQHEKQQFADLSGRLIYFLGQVSKISFDGSYRFQNGRGIDLDLSNFRAEYSTRFRSVLFTFGLEIYRRDFSGEKINYNGGYLKVERKF